MAAVLALLAQGCTSTPDPSTAAVPPSVTQVDGASQLAIPVAGLPSALLTLTVEPGDFATPGSISTSDLRIPGPEADWFTPAGPTREVHVDGEPARPLEIGFDAGPAHAVDVPVVWRQDPAVGWYPVAVGDAGGRATADRTRFSPHLPGWADVTKWASDRLAGATRWFRGRTDPPQCTSASPKWASTIAPTLDILLTCAQTDTADGVERVEVQVKNNRGLTQEIAIPDGVAYADVQDQPDFVRRLVRSIAGERDVVLLPPGKRLSIGFVRPATDRDIQLVPQVSNVALAVDAIVHLSDLASIEGVDSYALAMVELLHCAGVDGDVLQGVLPTTLDAVKTFVTKMGQCALEAGSDLLKATSLAEQYVALAQHVPQAIVQSDRAFTARVEQIAGRLRLAGTLLKGFDLFRMATIVWENVGELLGREIAGAFDPAALQLSMTAAAPPATRIVTVRPATAAGAPVAGWSMRSEALTVDCGYPSPASVSDNVQYCIPTAASADVCWPRPGGASVLCLWDPWERTLHEYDATGVIPVRAVADPEPVGLELDDGTRCRLRNGGSWSGRDDDPELVGFYSCSGDGFIVIWGPQDGSAITRKAGTWSVRVGTPTGPLRKARIVTAYLVGTA